MYWYAVKQINQTKPNKNVNLNIMHIVRDWDANKSNQSDGFSLTPSF